MADSTLRVAINADIRGLNANLNKAQTRLKAFSGRLKNIGGQLQTRLALPLIAAGGASIKMAADFDKSMTKIKTLVGVAGADVDAMAAGVKEMANVAGVSSGEAADALFFITSAGLRGADAMAVLEAATKASALGLGETATVADLATSALNAYGVENLSATGATDVLTAAVREGKLEASELSSVMGQVLPVASNMGVQFHEVGAAFAAMSRTGTPAAQAATQLNSILMAIMKPTKQSAEAMEQLGLSSQGLRQQIQDEGLLSVFQTLKTASEGNSEAFEKVFGNVRALKGILDLTGASAATTAEIFNRMANTSGVTAQAFDELQNSAEFRLRKGLRELQNQFTDLGAILMDSLMPVFIKIMNAVKGLFQRFANLSPETQQLAIAFGALAVVLPTVFTILGSLGSVIAVILSPVGLLIGALGLVLYYFDDIANATRDVRNALFENIGKALLKIELYFKKFMNVLKYAGKYISEFSENLFDGDFASIGAELDAEQKKLSDDINKRMDEHLAESMKRKGAPKYKNEISKLIKSYVGDIGIKAPSISSAAPAKEKSLFDIFGNADFKQVVAKTKKVTTSFAQLNANINANRTFGEKARLAMLQYKEAIQQVGLSIGDTLIASFEALANGGNFFETLINGLKQLIVKLLAAAAAAFILTTLLPSFFGGKGGFGKTFSALSGLKIPEMANGGIVNSPTLAMVGEYSGARSNPEVITPLDKLRGMIAQTGGQNVNVGGEFRIQGQDLVVALQRAERNRKRII